MKWSISLKDKEFIYEIDTPVRSVAEAIKEFKSGKPTSYHSSYSGKVVHMVPLEDGSTLFTLPEDRNVLI